MMTLTHYGWLGCCPCYFANIDSPEPVVVARHEWLEWLLTFSTWLAQCAGAFNTDAVFALRITGELNPPKELQ